MYNKEFYEVHIYFENQLSQNVKMQIFQMNVEHCTLHGRQKLSQNLLDVIQVDSFQGLSDPVQLFSRHIFSQFSALGVNF